MRSYQAILVLALSAFCMGVTEFVVAGILPKLAVFFEVAESKAGFLVTIYAIGVVIGAPLLSVPLSCVDRRRQLLINLAIFIVANLMIGLSTNFYLTAFARFVAGCMHGVFFVNATLSVLMVAPKGKENSSLSLMVSGLTIALVSGVPLGTFVGQVFGFQSVFFFIVFLSSCAFVGVFFLMPKNLESKQANFSSLYKALKIPFLLKVYCLTAATCGGAFVLYTYIASFLSTLSGFNEHAIGILLLVYGFGAILGNLFGGKLTDLRGSVMALRIILICQVIFFSLMGISAYSQIFVSINLFIMGFFAFAGISPLKSFAMIAAQKYAQDFKDSAVSVNEASFNVGIALASFFGGLIVEIFGVGYNPFFAALFVLPALWIVATQSRTI
ncbi:MFS transporter [Helicobacter sp. faydin-H20]|uniref:MFS transporter n=1 Tax=Helicobacter anatolicus TaxID=2905874 RepID=UPI001E4D8971|nr:MFS transporter [Helicobacter anatolicus]MCE3037317.1 MFS transporter [Helicobacter anatolicus]